jgi:hypothetical protein
MIGKIFDSAGIFLAAVLTLCGFLLLFLPWKAALAPASTTQASTRGVVYVETGIAKKSPSPQAPPRGR